MRNIITATFWICSLTLMAQWEKTNGPLGATFVEEVVSIDSTLYLSARSGGLYKSLDSGRTWISKIRGLPNQPRVEALIVHEGVLYAAINGNGVYKSSNRAESWVAANTGVQNETFSVLEIEGTDIFALGNSRGVYYSPDLGDSWIDRSSGTSDIRFHDATFFQSEIYVGGQRSFKSDDSGLSWTELTIEGINANGVSSMTSTNDGIYVGDDGHVFYSEDGVTWTQTNVNTSSTITSMGVKGDSVFATAAFAKVYFTSDSGDNWSFIQNESADRGFAWHVYFFDEQIIMSASLGLYTSFDNGATWELIQQGISAHNVEVLASDNSYLYAGTSRHGIFRWNFTDNWEQINEGLEETNAYTIYEIIPLNNLVYLGTGSGVYRSNSDRNSWTRLYDPGTNNSVQALAHDNGRLVGAVSNTGVYLSENLGESWTLLSTTDLEITNYEAITLKDDSIVVSTAFGRIFLSTDLGTNWSEISQTPQTTAFSLIFTETQLLAGTNDGLLISDNLGQNWSLFANDSRKLSQIVFKDDVMYGISRNQILGAEISGDQWRNISLNLENNSVTDLAITRDSLFVGTFSRSVWQRPLSEIPIPPLSNTVTYEALNHQIDGITRSSADWIDYDSDGLMDLSINGINNEQDGLANGALFRNQGDSTFSLVDAGGFTKTQDGDQDWGDYNNDGLVDLILTGTTSGAISDNVTEIHKNLGNNQFREIAHPIPGISKSGDVQWVDLDADGDLDLFVMGLDSESNLIVQVFENQGRDIFVAGPELITGGSGEINGQRNQSVWADFDNDGDMDGIVAYSSEVGGFGVKVFENLGSLNFEAFTTTMPQLNYVSMDIFDVNNDDRMDLAISGTLETSVDSQEASTFLAVMRNGGGLNFSYQFVETIGLYWGNLDCGDYNNDGFSDILINGWGNGTQGTFILENQGGFSFVQRDLGLSSTNSGGALWGKLRSENNLDVYVHGTTSTNTEDASSFIFVNEVESGNNAPSVPEGLSYQLIDCELVIRWDGSVDDKTGLNGITYNIALGTSSSEFDLINPHANASGTRKITELGNHGFKDQFDFSNLNFDKLHFQVQAIDNAFNASAFSDELVIDLDYPSLPDSLAIYTDESVTLNGGEFDTYLWSTGSTDNQITVNQQGWYQLEVLNMEGCTVQDSTYLTVNPLPMPTLNDSARICQGDSILLDAGSFQTYSWDSGETTASIYVDTEGWHAVTVTDENGRSGSDSTYLTLDVLPISLLPDSLAACQGDSVLLEPGTFASYDWDNGTSNASIYVSTERWHSVSFVDENGCSTSDSTFLAINEIPVIALSDSVTICEYDSALITLEGYSSYSWSTGESSSEIYVNNAGTYTVTVIDENGCIGADSTYLNVLAATSAGLPDSTSVCEGDFVVLDPGSFSSYSWSTGESTSTINTANEGWYSVALTNENGCTSFDTTYVLLNSITSPNLPDSVSICEGDSIFLGPGEFASYSWNTGETKSSIYASNAGWYIVTIMNESGCTAKDSSFVSVDSAPELIIDNLMVTQDESIEIDPGEFERYLWSNGYEGRIFSARADTLELGDNVFQLQVWSSDGCIASTTFTVSVSVSLNSSLAAANIKTFIQGDHLMLENLGGLDYDYQIFSLTGKRVSKGRLLPYCNGEITLKRGMYILKLAGGNKLLSQKILITP